MTNTMITIIALIAAAKYQKAQPYLKKFTAGNNYFDAVTSKIRLDDIYSHYVEAGVVNRGDELPVIKVNGFDKLEIEPPIVGGQFPYSAEDLLATGAGVVEYTTTGPLTSEESLRKKYTTIAKASIENRKERMAADIFLTGKTKGTNGEEIDMGLDSVITIDMTGKSMTNEIVNLISRYYTRHGVTPTVDVGIDVFNKIKDEAENKRQNINKISVNGDINDTSSMYLIINNFKVGLLSTHGNINPKNRITLSNPESMGLAFAGLTFGDIKNNKTVVVKSRLLAGETTVNTIDGSKGLWAKSAPLPLAINVKQFERYDITL